jgi:4-carboxymuconolactone decarboxylase
VVILSDKQTDARTAVTVIRVQPSDLFEEGLGLATANEFTRAFQGITTEWCWGYAWKRPGLDRKTRSLLNLVMLSALNRGPELKLHVRGALNNGVTVKEIKGALIHATVYCGIPAGLDAFKALMKS